TDDAREGPVVEHQQVVDPVIEGEPSRRRDHGVRRQRVELGPHHLGHTAGTDFSHDIHDVPSRRKSSGRGPAGYLQLKVNKRCANPIGCAGRGFPRPRACVASPGPCGCYQARLDRHMYPHSELADLGSGFAIRRGMDSTRILLVDDDDETRELLRDFFGDRGYAVETAGDGAKALMRLATFAADIVITDLEMPGMSGLELIRSL